MRDLIWFLVFQLGLTSAVFADGGVSGGGGGGTVIANPVDSVDVRGALSEARQNLFLVLHRLDREVARKTAAGETVKPILTKLFADPAGLYKALREMKIYVRHHGPCLSPSGTEVDGSAPYSSSEPLSVCMSSHNLVRKLSKDNYRTQIFALLGHEVSHLIGFDETEATSLQLHLIDQLASYPIPVFPNIFWVSEIQAQTLFMNAYFLRERLQNIGVDSTLGTIADFKDAMRIISRNALDLSNTLHSISFNSALSSEMEDQYAIVRAKLNSVQCGFERLGGATPTEYCLLKETDVFGKEDLLLLPEYWNRMGLRHQYLGKDAVVVRKVETLSGLIVETAELAEAAEHIRTHLRLINEACKKRLIDAN